MRFPGAASGRASAEAEAAAAGGGRAGTSACTACTSESCTGELCCLKEEHLEMLNTLENVFNAAEQPDVAGEVRVRALRFGVPVCG